MTLKNIDNDFKKQRFSIKSLVSKENSITTIEKIKELSKKISYVGQNQSIKFKVSNILEDESDMSKSDFFTNKSIKIKSVKEDTTKSFDLSLDKITHSEENKDTFLSFRKEIKPMLWDMTKFKPRYFTPPRYLVVEDNLIGRRDMARNLRNYSTKHYIDLADTGNEAISKFKKMITQGFIYDYIFMDIDLPDIKGDSVTKIMRDYEKDYGVRTLIAAVTVSNIEDFAQNKLFDYFSKCLLINFIFLS